MPASFSIATVNPNFKSCVTVAGVAATLVSLESRSLGIPIRIIFPSYPSENC